MNYGSVCSGVEAATLAWERLGWIAKFYAEVEPFPAAVLAQRFGASRPLDPVKAGGVLSMSNDKLMERYERKR